MKAFARFGQWLHGCLFGGRPSPLDDPEVKQLATRVEALEEVTEGQGRRMSAVEVRVGLRSPSRWRGRDAS